MKKKMIIVLVLIILVSNKVMAGAGNNNSKDNKTSITHTTTKTTTQKTTKKTKTRKPNPELDYTERSPYHDSLIDSLVGDVKETLTITDDYGNPISLDFIDIVHQNNNY